MKQATLCFLLKDDEILLGMKKRGFGVGKWNGMGGKVNSDESITDAIIRKTKEEIGVTITKFKKMAELDFYFSESPENNWGQKVHVFLVDKWKGNPQEFDEMRPQWFKLNKIPFIEMWEDEEIWLPLVLQNKYVTGEFYFDKNQKLINYNLNEE